MNTTITNYKADLGGQMMIDWLEFSFTTGAFDEASEMCSMIRIYPNPSSSVDPDKKSGPIASKIIQSESNES